MNEGFETYEKYETEEMLRKRIRRELQNEVEKEARKKWDLSHERWGRFVSAFLTTLTVALVVALGWVIVSWLGAINADSEARTAWDKQCRVDGGIVFKSTDEYGNVRACVIAGEVARYR